MRLYASDWSVTHVFTVYKRRTSTSNEIPYVFLSLFLPQFQQVKIFFFFFLVDFIWRAARCSLDVQRPSTVQCSRLKRADSGNAQNRNFCVGLYNCGTVVRNELWWECTSYLMNDKSLCEDRYNSNEGSVWWTARAEIKILITPHLAMSMEIVQNNQIFDATALLGISSIITGGDECGERLPWNECLRKTYSLRNSKIPIRKCKHANYANILFFLLFLRNDTQARQKQMWRGCHFFHASPWCFHSHRQKCASMKLVNGLINCMW